jgi:phosphate transport system substrate-binding protein
MNAMNIMNRLMGCRVVLILSAALAVGAASQASARVRILTKNGSLITGISASLQGGLYTVKTEAGNMQVPQAIVTKVEGDVQAVTSPPVPPPSPPPLAGPLRLAGSTTVGDELAPALLEGFAAEKGDADINWTQENPAELAMDAKGPRDEMFKAHLSRHGSGTAFLALAAGEADIGMASRRINQLEAGQLSAAGRGDFFQPGLENVLALDGLILIVNKANPIPSLKMNEIKDIFSGRITDWSQVGGQPGPIHLFGRDSHSGTADTFAALAMGGTKVSPSVNVVEGSDGITLKVQGDPNAIGYVGFAYLGNNKALTIITECGLQFLPSDLYVRTEEYPLSRRLYLYAPANPTNTNSRAFIDYALSDKGQALARKKNFIDLVPQLAPDQYGPNAIELNFVNLLNDKGATQDDINDFVNYARHALVGNRVSTTFRFQFASAALDARAVRDIDRLAEFLKGGAAAHRSVLVAGFADTDGTSLGSRQLSQVRARNIAQLLHNKGVEAKDVVGYGRVAPVACNSTPEGREKNRRVEIWLD